MKTIPISERVNEKFNYSIDLIQRGEKLALSLNPEKGYIVAFSGGKDSQLLLDLVKQAGVKYEAHYYVTTVDPPECIYYMREKYPEVKFVLPEENFFRLVEKHGLPTIRNRYCCRLLKEGQDTGCVVLTGVRAEESKKRAAYEDLTVMSSRKEHKGRTGYTIEAMMENEHQCIKGKDKVMLRPILHWTMTEEFYYFKSRGIEINPAYLHVNRLSCMLCPFSPEDEKEYWMNHHPGYKRLLLRSIGRYMAKSPSNQLSSPEEYYEWWCSKRSIEEFLKKKERYKQI